MQVNAPSSQAPLPTNVDLGPSHFREVCSLALDLGRPELLYTFLALPANHAAWAGRRASRFLTSSGPGRKRRREEELQASLEPLLPKIVPRLFRGRFEPSGPARKVGRLQPAGRGVGSKPLQVHLGSLIDRIEGGATVASCSSDSLTYACGGRHGGWVGWLHAGDGAAVASGGGPRPQGHGEALPAPGAARAGGGLARLPEVEGEAGRSIGTRRSVSRRTAWRGAEGGRK